MESFLFEFVSVVLLVSLLGFFNEKVTKLTHEIALMLFSAILGVLVLVGVTVFNGTPFANVLQKVEMYDFEEFLMKGVLCFMLFAGSCHHKTKDMIKSLRQISVLAFVCTFLGAVFYGLLFYGGAKLIGLNISMPICLMFGSIIAPTDPIAATSILKKFGLPKNVSFLIESESLFNDGVGVALFVCFSGLVSASKASASSGFFAVMFKQVFGAAAIAIAVTGLCFLMFRFCKNHTLKTLISLLNVSAAYLLCEEFGCSGAIASVICGIMFATLRSKYMKDEDEKDAESFNSFWETLDGMFNSFLYVMLGLSFVGVFKMQHVLLLSLIAITANFISRAGGLTLSSLIIGKLPDNYDKPNFIKLFTWGGLRGGLSVALAMSTKSMLPEDIYYIIIGGTFAVVFFTTVVQGLTMKTVYKRISASVIKKQAAKGK